MEQRNTLCTHQMLDLQPVQGLSHHHRDQCIFPGNLVDYANLNTNQTIQPVSAGTASDLGLQFKDYHDRGMFSGNHYNSSHNFFHPIRNLGPATPATHNFIHPSTVPTSSSRNFPIPWDNGSIDCLPSSFNRREIGVTMDEFGRNIDTRVYGKRKNAETPAENHFNMTGMRSSGSPPLFSPSNSLLPQWEQSYELGPTMVDATNNASPEYLGREIIQNTEGSHGSAGCRSSATGLQPGPASFPHHNYVLCGIQMGQPLQVDGNMWTSHFHIGNNIGNGIGSSWNYVDPSLHGSFLGSGGFEMINMSVHAYNSASSISNSAVLFNPASMPDFGQQLPPMQTMQVQSYGHCAQVQAQTYENPTNNLHLVNAYASTDAPVSGSTFVRFPSNSEQIYRPWRVHHTAPVSHGSLRLLSAQDTAAMEMSEFYGAGNVIDHHHDMRLDIDEMSYEELLALEEHIGDVKTGLTEEYIRKNLKTTVHNLQIESLSAEQSQENECCIICQVEYEQDGILGTLDCGHHYHEECIKQWLLLKNLCPICKITALAAPKTEG
ncbi:E3 ubiquitin-protein ligase Arkadia-like [Iris pallida]|uniref:RING-type E3 ubiquitin transferase n=1 Tax=Iris pallida TaxID=29817 RepID=A0AAX6GW00_IRIPA|nr:E3 ubiquitin-protein ligase Arkadia-like [Iris pallida]KAJ6850908.1 E3 ubiquitin-protein ligase Arkadia-like [Iris pallida]